jgi:hypothetical protein
MVHSSVIEKINLAVVKMVSKEERRRELSLALMVTASLDGGGEGTGSGDSLLCLWSENSTRQWIVHNIVIEKNKISRCENGV